MGHRSNPPGGAPLFGPCFTICNSDFSIVACSIAGSSSAFSSSTIQSTVGPPVPRFIQASSLGVVWPSTMKVASGKCPRGLHPQETASCWPNSKWASVSDQTSSPMFEAKRTCKMDKPMVSNQMPASWSGGTGVHTIEIRRHSQEKSPLSKKCMDERTSTMSAY